MAISTRCESGLQVVQHIAGIATSLYGTNEKYKCVRDRDSSIHLNCVGHILQNIDIQHPVGHLVIELVQNHHTTYGCGTKTLLMMLDLLAQSALTLRDKGIDEMTIVRGLIQGVEMSISMFPTVPLSSFFDIPQTLNEVKCSNEDQVRKSTSVRYGTLTNKLQSENDVEIETTQNQCEYRNGLPLCNMTKPDLNFSVNDAPYIHLQMKPKQNDDKLTCEGTDEDDLGWFFDDGKVPTIDSLEEPIKELISKVGNVLDKSCNDVMECQFEKLKHLSTLPGPEYTKESFDSTRTSPFSSLRDTVDDSEFDSCLDTLPMQRNESLPTTTGQISPEQRLTNGRSKEDSDDEFDNCFDDVSYSICDTKSVLSGANILKSSVHADLGCRIEDRNSPEANFDNNTEHFDTCFEKQMERETIEAEFQQISGDFSRNSIMTGKDRNSQLKDILKRKSSQNKANIHNQSRHFKTIETSMNIMQVQSAYEKHIDEENLKWSPVQNLNDKIESIMNSKQTLKKGIVLNRSRHYRDISSSVSEMSSSIEKKSPELSESKAAEGVFFSPEECSLKRISSTAEDICDSKIYDINQEANEGNIGVYNVSEPVSRMEISHLFKESKLQNGINESCDKMEAGKGIENDEIKEIRSLPPFTSSPQISDSLMQDMPATNQSCPASLHLEKMSPVVTEERLRSLVLSLCRGDEQIAQMLSTVAWQQQQEQGKCSRKSVSLAEISFEPCRVHSVTLPGVGMQRSEVVQGLVVPASLDDLELLQYPTKRRALLINGDVSPNFQHRGKNKKAETVLISKRPASTSRNERWLGDLARTLDKIKKRAPDALGGIKSNRSPAHLLRSNEFLLAGGAQQFNVTAMLVKGNVIPEVRDICHGRHVVLMTHVPSDVILALAETTQSDIATYVTECTKDNIVEDVMIKPWTPDWSDQVTCLSYTAFVQITTEADIVQTAVMCHPCRDVGEALEERFWHAAYRLRNVVASAKIMEGHSDLIVAARLETAADKMLKESQEGASDNVFPVLLETLAAGFRSLAITAQLNNPNQQTPTNTENPTHLIYNTTKYQTGLSEPRRTPTNCDNHSYLPKSGPLELHCGFNSTQKQSSVESAEETSAVPEDLPSEFSKDSKFQFGGNGGHRCADDYTSKVEAIRSAAHLVCQVLQMDYEVVTGLTETQPPESAGMVAAL